jgi:3',5'-cyclic AMP phosphodiesterase CpdA
MQKRVFLLLTFFALLWLSQSQAQSDGDSFRFVFMTDIHLWEKNMAAEGFQQALDTAVMLRPDFLLTGGDLVMDVLRTSQSRADSLFMQYKQAIGSLAVPVYNALGNHEVFGWGNKLSDPNHPDYGKNMFKRHLGSYNHRFSHKNWEFMVIEGVRHNDSTAYDGWVTEETLDWIRMELSRIATGTPIVLVSHIPLMTLEGQWFNGALAANHPMDVVGNAKEVLSLFSSHKLKLVLQGHLHFYEKLFIGGITYITGGAVSGKWWKGAYHGTEPGFVVVDINGDSFKARYQTFGWDAGN